MNNPFTKPAGLYPASELSNRQLKAEQTLSCSNTESLLQPSHRPMTPLEQGMVKRRIELTEEVNRRNKK